MADPLQIDLIAARRVPYGEFFSFLEEDYTGSTLLLQVRRIRDTTGTPLIARATGTGLSIPYSATATVGAHVAAGRLLGDGEDNIYEITNPATGDLYVAGDSLTLSQIFISFSTGNLLAADFPDDPDERGQDVVRPYDMIRTPASGDPVMQMSGNLIIRAGVTIP